MKGNTEFQKRYDLSRDQIERALEESFTGMPPQVRLLKSMRYSLLAGGKRIRPILTMQFCRAAGGREEDALDYACAVEMLHTYSLIHDDLPAMDDDALRRGKPTNHKVYGEFTAVLAGDALQAEAFGRIARASSCSVESRTAACGALAAAAGAFGMCGGQYLDMAGRETTLEGLTAMHRMKTAALLRAACQLGVLAAECNSDSPQYRAAEGYAEHIGLAFQIRDDILDETATVEALGKPRGSDEKNGKHTFYTLLGQEKSEALIRENTHAAKAMLDGVFRDIDFLSFMAEMLAGRES